MTYAVPGNKMNMCKVIPWLGVSLIAHGIAFTILAILASREVIHEKQPQPMIFELKEMSPPARVQTTSAQPVRTAEHRPPVTQSVSKSIPQQPAPPKAALPVMPHEAVVPTQELHLLDNNQKNIALPVAATVAIPLEGRRQTSHEQPRQTEKHDRTGPDIEGARSSYLKALRSMIEQRKEYPLFARRNKLEGTVLIRFTVSMQGQLITAHVARSSGLTILDNAALNTVKGVGQYPPLPDIISEKEILLEIPVVFRIKTD